jgi:gliding motility-associated protein GldL
VKSNAALDRFDDLVAGVGGIDPALIQNLGSSFEKLNETAAGISDVSQASAVTTQYVENVGAAAQSVGGLSLAFQQSAAGLQQSAMDISHSSSAFTAISDSSQGYANQLEGMNKNIAQLNAVYEMQLRSTSEQMQKSQAVYSDMEQMLENITKSVEETHRYREEMASLNRNLASLNTIYGNMLSAMTMNVRA